MSEDRNKIIARVKKLREIRVDRGAAEAEADTAKRLADKLVEKYSIADDELKKSDDNFMDSIFGNQEGFTHERTESGETFSFKFGGSKPSPDIDGPLGDFIKAMMGTGLGSFFHAMRNAGDGPSSFERELFRAVDELIRNWGAKGDRKREDDKEDSEAPDSIEG